MASLVRTPGAGPPGPPPREAFPAIPRSAQLAAIAESLDWYAAHEPDHRAAVLTAARGLPGRGTSRRPWRPGDPRASFERHAFGEERPQV